MSKLVVFGSARVDAFLGVPSDKVDKLCNLDTKKCVVEFTYGAKIPMESVEFLVGGNGANVSVGTKRLGVDSFLVAEVGTGVMADHTRQELSKEIDTTFVTQTPGVPQGFGAVIMYQGERTILSYYPPVTPPFPDNLDGADWAYLTSTGEDFEEYYEKIYNWLNVSNAKVVFNPGGRQISKGLEWMKKYLDKTYLLILNREEGESLVNFKESQGKEKQLLDLLTQTGAKQVVVTDGNNGGYAKTVDGKYLRIGVIPIDAYERTGAGDAFSTGCMSALILGKTLEEGLIWGTVNSTSVIGFVGPQKGLLNQQRLQEWIDMAKASGLSVEELK